MAPQSAFALPSVPTAGARRRFAPAVLRAEGGRCYLALGEPGRRLVATRTRPLTRSARYADFARNVCRRYRRSRCLDRGAPRPLASRETLERLRDAGLLALRGRWSERAEITSYLRDAKGMAPIHRDQRLANPAFLLGLTNWVFGRNVKLDAWLHLETWSQHYHAVAPGDELVVEAAVADLFEKKGHQSSISTSRSSVSRALRRWRTRGCARSTRCALPARPEAVQQLGKAFDSCAPTPVLSPSGGCLLARSSTSPRWPFMGAIAWRGWRISSRSARSRTAISGILARARRTEPEARRWIHPRHCC